jgi:hypothetical protein
VTFHNIGCNPDEPRSAIISSGCFIMRVSLLYEEGSGSDAETFQSRILKKPT